MKLASRRSSPSCSQITLGWRGSICAQPLPRCVESVAPALHGVGDLRPGRPRVPDRHADLARHQVLDQGQHARGLRGDGHEPDAPLGRVLATPEVVDVGPADERAGVGAARAVLRRDVGPLHVDAGDRRVLRADDGPRARGERLERRGDERRQEAGDARLLDRGHRLEHPLGRERGVAEVDTREPVHLQVDEPRELDGALPFRHAALPRFSEARGAPRPRRERGHDTCHSLPSRESVA